MTSAHSPSSAYHELRAMFTRLSRFGHLSAIAGWDMQTMMPPGGNKARSEALAELSVLQHQILTAEKTGHLFERAQQETLDGFDQANLLEMRRQYDNAVLVPESLVEAKSLAGARCEHAWRSQRPPTTGKDFRRICVKWSS
ncbi:Thermostable carboxypeptidase 1 [Serratia plymuthica]|nr:Thermostable carboxypeptidase 1 [Serratia plymuthica]